MAKFKFRNLALLIVASLAGGFGMSKWDQHEVLAKQQALEGHLLKYAQAAKVDPHRVGLHGKYFDVHHDIDCGDLPSPREVAEVAAADEKARRLFDTPGGAYTNEDIAKNGLVPPSIRFRNVVFMYQMIGLPEQPIDPITGTRTCGAFDWSIGGKTYHFCSIPTLEEFVARAKRDPKSILPPSAYVYHATSTRVAAR